jgi:hypothetical protein
MNELVSSMLNCLIMYSKCKIYNDANVTNCNKYNNQTNTSNRFGNADLNG